MKKGGAEIATCVLAGMAAARGAEGLDGGKQFEMKCSDLADCVCNMAV